MGWVLWGSFVGALVLFGWNAVAWMVLHHHTPDFKPLSNPKPVEDALGPAGATQGLYMVPHQAHFEKGFADPELAKRIETAPSVLLVVSPPGPCMGAMTFVYGFLVNLGEAFGLALAVHYARGSLTALPEVVWFATLLGVLVHGAPILAQSVWLRMPWQHSWKTVGDGVAGFAMLGVLYHYFRS
jgi:hypothetical protein